MRRMGQVPPPPPNYANYPRPGYTGSGDRPPGVYFETIGEAWNLMSKNLGLWVGASAVGAILILIAMIPYYVVAIGSTLAQLANDRPTETATGLGAELFSVLLSFLGSMVSTVVMASLGKMALMALRGQTVVFSDLFLGFKRFIPIAMTGLAYSVLCTVGFLMCLVPGVFVVGALAFATLIAADQEVGPIDAIRMSYEALKKHAWMMFLLLLVLGVLMYVSAICCVGMLFTLPLMSIVIAMHYNYFFPNLGTGQVAGYVPTEGPRF